MASVEVAESYRPVKCFTSARPVTRKLISIYKHVVPTCRFFYFYLISRIPRRGILTKADGLHIVGPRYTAESQVLKCTKPEPEWVGLNCSSGGVINVHEAIYGRNKWGECLYTAGDCTEKFDINELCCGQTNCSFSIRKAYSLECGYFTFFRVIYTCIKVHELTCGEAAPGATQKPIDLTSPPHTTAVGVATQTTSSTSDTPSTDDKPDTKATRISTTNGTPDDMPVIIGSAVAVAVLLVAILAVLFILRRFSWEKEKFCILGLFVSLCKRQPPDGSEEPDEHIRGTRSNGDTPDFVERGEKPQVDSNQNVQTTKMTPSTQEGVEIDTKNIPTIFRVIDHGYCSQTMTQQRPCVETAITDV
ncbi:hypothetical protein ScPMuIL_012124 [Solemya velum]